MRQYAIAVYDSFESENRSFIIYSDSGREAMIDLIKILYRKDGAFEEPYNHLLNYLNTLNSETDIKNHIIKEIGDVMSLPVLIPDGK